MHVWGRGCIGCVLGRLSPWPQPALFALVDEVAGDVAQDEDDPEEGQASQHPQGEAQPARTQLPGEPRARGRT